MAGGADSVRRAAVQLADRGIEAAQALGRPDLVAGLGRLQTLASNPSVRVLVAGEYKQGKSSLVNALLGRDLCPVEIDRTTRTATWIRHATALEVTLVRSATDDEVVEEPADPAELAHWVTEGGAPGEPLEAVSVGVPVDLLRVGLELVDLPGAGGLGGLPGAATLAALPEADAVLLVSDSGQDLTATEKGFLAELVDRCPLVALVENRTDLHPHWREVVERDRRHAGGMAAEVFGVSAELARTGRAAGDVERVAESGVAELAFWLTGEVVGGADERAALLVADEVLAVAGQVRAPVVAERAALDDPARRAEREAALAAARDDAERLQAASSRWQQVLTDGFSDLSADVDHDLRLRVRDLVGRSDEAIDGFDPADAWERYEPVLRRDVATMVTEHQAELTRRAGEVAARVAAVFAEDVDALEGLLGSGTGLAAVTDEAAIGPPSIGGSLRRMGIGGQAFALARGSYSPSLMFGFLGGVVGITLATPALLAIGLVAGGKGLRAEKQRRLAARQTQAKAAARKYVDDVVFQVGKASRDEVRRAQRVLRAHFASRAQELSRSASAALAAAQRAARAEDDAARRHELDLSLERIDTLVDLARRVQGALEGPAT